MHHAESQGAPRLRDPHGFFLTEGQGVHRGAALRGADEWFLYLLLFKALLSVRFQLFADSCYLRRISPCPRSGICNSCYRTVLPPPLPEGRAPCGLCIRFLEASQLTGTEGSAEPFIWAGEILWVLQVCRAVQCRSEGSSTAAGMLCAGLFVVTRCVVLVFWAEIDFFFPFLVPEIPGFGKGYTSMLQWAEHNKVF